MIALTSFCFPLWESAANFARTVSRVRVGWSAGLVLSAGLVSLVPTGIGFTSVFKLMLMISTSAAVRLSIAVINSGVVSTVTLISMFPLLSNVIYQSVNWPNIDQGDPFHRSVSPHFVDI